MKVIKVRTCEQFKMGRWVDGKKRVIKVRRGDHLGVTGGEEGRVG